MRKNETKYKNSKNKTHSQTLEERVHDQPASVRAGPPKIMISWNIFFFQKCCSLPLTCIPSCPSSEPSSYSPSPLRSPYQHPSSVVPSQRLSIESICIDFRVLSFLGCFRWPIQFIPKRAWWSRNSLLFCMIIPIKIQKIWNTHRNCIRHISIVKGYQYKIARHHSFTEKQLSLIANDTLFFSFSSKSKFCKKKFKLLCSAFADVWFGASCFLPLLIQTRWEESAATLVKTT